LSGGKRPVKQKIGKRKKGRNSVPRGRLRNRQLQRLQLSNDHLDIQKKEKAPFMKAEQKDQEAAEQAG